MTPNQRDRLVVDLVELDPSGPHRYRNQPEFRAAVDTLVGLAEDMVRLAAERADRHAAIREQALRDLSPGSRPSAAFPGFPQQT